MIRKISCVIIATLLMTVSVYAGPSKPIHKMLTTPISAFDFFLFELEEKCKCDKWFGNPNWKTDPCMTILDYNIQENLIFLTFYIFEPNRSTTYMKGFINSNEAQKEQILLTAIQKLAVVLGVAKRESMGKRYGLIQLTPIRRGWFSKDFNEPELKKEIAQRTVLVLQTKYKEKLYNVERQINGEVKFEVTPVKETKEVEVRE